MRMDDFDSQYHFVPFQPEAVRTYSRTNRLWIVLLAVFVVGVFIATMAPRRVRNAVTATKFGAAVRHKAKTLAPNHAAASGPQSRQRFAGAG